MKISTLFSIRYVIIIAFLFMQKLLFAQDPVIVSLTLLPPYPNFAYEVVDMGNQSIITLQNTDFNNGHSVKLGVELTGSNGIIVRSKENAMPNHPINLEAGESLVLTGEDLSGFYNNYTESDFDFIGITMEEVLNDQQLPDGLYTLCVRAYDYNTGFPLSPSSPLGCAAPFVVIAVDPPIITYPLTESVVDSIEPQLMNINWIPVTISLPDLRYRIEMVDITDMPINPYDAFLTGDFLFFWEDDIISNTFFYGMEYPLLEVGHEYAIRVRAYLLDGLLNVGNGGYSDIVTFTYGDGSDDEQDSVSVVELTTLPDLSLNCGSDCLFHLTGSETSSSEDPTQGNTLKFGNFEMLVNNIETTGPGIYKGTGIIKASSYIPIGIKVDFVDVRVDDNLRVFEGEATATIRENSWIDHTWADIQTFAEDININDYGDVYDAATNPEFYIDNLTNASQQIGTSIPISIGTQDHSLQIVGMNFFPERASFNLSYISKLADDPTTGERYLHFMSKDLCISPGGPVLQEEDAKLFLVKDFNYTFDNSTRLTFKADDPDQPGTYLNFDCNGFVGINAVGDVRFSPEVFIPVDEQGVVKQGDTLVATFRTTFIDWSDWVGFVSFDSEHSDGNVDASTSANLFIHKELEDYIFRVETAYFDHSINSNPADMQFPENYPSPGPEWEGFYIKTMRVDLPKWMKIYGNDNDRVKVSAKDLLVDSEGLTGIIQATNVLGSEEGALAKWPLTIDSLHIEVVQNNLSNAFFKGGLRLPVIDEPFDYNADLQFLEETTTHTFNFSPVDSYTFSKWFAEATLENNSKLLIKIENGNAFAEARLFGKLSFAPLIGDIDKMNLSDITFNDLVIRSERRPSYIEFGNIGTNISEKTLAVAGFGVIIDKIGWDESDIRDAGLSLMVGMDLAGGPLGISGNTALILKNKIEPYVDSISFQFDGVSLSDINLEVETGAIDLKGKISFFKNDTKFGNGFNGSLDINFIKTVRLNGSVMFGNKIVNSKSINYWYASAMAYLPNNPIPMATPLDLYGFGGGFYYNMSLDPDFKLTPGTGALLDPKEIFSVAPGTIGFQASVLTALTPSSRTFNADVTLSVEINDNGGLNNISLDGIGYVMQDIDETDKQEAMVYSEVSIGINFKTHVYTGHFGVHGKIPKAAPILIVDGDIDFYRSPDTWHLWAGIPEKKLTTSLNIGFAEDALSVGAYFMTGMQLKPPIIPKEVQSFFDFKSDLARNLSTDLGIGFLAGVHLSLDLDLTALGTGIQINAKAGVDIGLINYATSTCNGNIDFGINKWYAQGQGYIYGRFGLEVLSFDALTVEAGVILQGAFPNPTGVKGKVKAEVTVLGFSVEVSKDFSLGSICLIEPIPGMEVERLELELENMDLIGVVSPVSGAPYVSTSVQPTVQWFKKDGEMKGYIYGDGQGGIVSKLFRFNNEIQWQLLGENNTRTDVNYSESIDESENISTLMPTNANGDPSLINGLRIFSLKARSYIEQFSGTIADYQNNSYGGSWGPANYLEGPKKGQQIEQIKEHIFITRSNLTEIDINDVVYTLPFKRQRFYPFSYLSQGKVNFNKDQELKFQEFENCGFVIQAEFKEAGSSSEVQVLPTNRPELMNLEFDMGTLSPETIYKLEIVAERKITDLSAVMETDADNPSCAIKNVQFLDEMMDAFSISTDLGNFSDASGLQNLGPDGLGINTIENYQDYIIHRKKLFTLYFRTSKFATPQDKLNAIMVTNTETVPSGEFYTDTLTLPIFEYQTIFNNFLNINTTIPVIVGYQEVVQQTPVQNALISLYCPEGFDRYDLLGHSYTNPPDAREYFKFYGPSHQTPGLSTEVQNWFNYTFINLNGFGQDPTSTQVGGDPGGFQYYQNTIDGFPKLWEVNYASDPSSPENIKYLYPLLSDVEVGISSPEVVINTDNSNTSSSGGFNFGGSGGFTPITNILPSLTNLQLEYRVELNAYNKRKYILNNVNDGIGPHQSPPSGIYPFSVLQSNDINNGYPASEIPTAKTLNATITYD